MRVEDFSIPPGGDGRQISPWFVQLLHFELHVLCRRRTLFCLQAKAWRVARRYKARPRGRKQSASAPPCPIQERAPPFPERASDEDLLPSSTLDASPAPTHAASGPSAEGGCRGQGGRMLMGCGVCVCVCRGWVMLGGGVRGVSDALIRNTSADLPGHFRCTSCTT